MKMFKRLTLTSALGVGLAVCAMQSATAADAYTEVSATANQAAKFALSKNWTGARATCYIAFKAREKANILAKTTGPKINSPQYKDMIARTTLTSAKANKIKELLSDDRVHLDCRSGVGLPVVGGTLAAVAAIAALSSGGSSSSNRAVSAE